MASRVANPIITNYIAAVENARKENRSTLREVALRWNDYANKISSELSKHLFTIAAVIFPLSLLPLTNVEFLPSLGEESKLFLTFAYLSLIGSLISGIFHLIKSSEFFEKYGRQENERSQQYDEMILTLNPVDAFNRFDQMNKNSILLNQMPQTPMRGFLYSQVGLLLTGILMIGLVLYTKLFFNYDYESSCNEKREPCGRSIHIINEIR